jgi:polyribonucleotide nucleotidyltransferase
MDSIAIEGEMKEISEAEMLEAIKFAHEHIKTKSAQLRLQAAFGKKRSSYLRRRKRRRSYLLK